MRVSAYIDGFNLYHAIHAKFDKSKKYLKWLDIKKLVSAYIDQKNDVIVSVVFFSAFPNHQRPETRNTHNIYVQALKSTGIKYIEGNFKQKYLRCKNCRTTYIAHEEKESDVNLAIYIVKDAYENISDKIIVITNDSDIAPALTMAKKVNPSLKIKIITPPLPDDNHKKTSHALLEAAGQTDRVRGKNFRHPIVIKETILARCRLPEVICFNGLNISCPNKYKL
jgi:uncharacterized LabA/DUF88 family protein